MTTPARIRPRLIGANPSPAIGLGIATLTGRQRITITIAQAKRLAAELCLLARKAERSTKRNSDAEH